MAAFQRNPPYAYPTLEGLKEARPEPPGLRRLAFDEKSTRFGDPTSPTFEQDCIVEVGFPGFGASGKDLGVAKVNKLIVANATSAFEEIASLRLGYVLHPFGPHATYCLRYGKSTRNAALFGADPSYAGIPNPQGQSWNVLFAEHDRAHGRFNTPVGGETKGRKEHLSNHSWGTALDINPSTNPMKSGAPFDLPPEIVQVMGRWGFYWGGYFNPPDGDYMHFEFAGELAVANRFPVPPPTAVYPFGEAGKRESPTKYFFLNETGSNGFFPLGLQQNLHGGVHLSPDSLKFRPAATSEEGSESDAAETAPAPASQSAADLVPVRACLPGYIVAARLIPPSILGDFPMARLALDGQPLGMVLVRHELVLLDDKGAEPKGAATFPIFSLYMHLVSPDWSGKDARFEGAGWLERFLRMQHGAVVDLDPAHKDDLGRTFWAMQPAAPDAAAVAVRGRLTPLPTKSGDAIVGVFKPAPEAITRAVKAFRQGALVTFDRPIFPVQAGDVIGFLGDPAGVPGSSDGARRYLHFEIFSFAGETSGLAKLREADAELSAPFKVLPDAIHDHNFLSMPGFYTEGAPNQIKPLFQNTDAELEGTLTDAEYAARLIEVFRKGSRAPGSTTAAFRYPVTIRLANPYNYQPEAGEPGSDILEVTFRQAGQTLSKLQKKITFDDPIQIDLEVPADADEIALWAKHFHVVVAPRRPPEPEGSTEKERRERQVSLANAEAKALRSAQVSLFRDLVGRRWRNLAMVHLNEWTRGNLDTYLETRANAGFLDLDGDGQVDGTLAQAKRELAPLTWWARPRATDADPLGEVLAFGDQGSRQDSLFGAGDGRLPKDARIEDMHPISALWLADLLVQRSKVAFRAKWDKQTLVRETLDGEVLFFGIVAPPGARLGSEVALAVVDHGYGSSEDGKVAGVTFRVHPGTLQPRVLSKASYVEGAAVTRVHFPYWGDTRVEAAAVTNKDESAQAVTAARMGLTKLSLPRPTPATKNLPLVHVSGSKADDHLWTGTLLFERNAPDSLQALLAFDCWTVSGGEAFDDSKPSIRAKLACPVVATSLADRDGVVDGLRFKGEMVLAPQSAPTSKKKQKDPLAAWRVSVTEDAVLRDFVITPSAKPVMVGPLEDFTLALPLAHRLQALRDIWKAAHARFGLLQVVRLAATGLSLDVAPSRPTPDALTALHSLAAKLPPSTSFTAAPSADGKALRLTYTPNRDGGALSFTVDLKPALRQLANIVLTSDKQRLYTRVRLVAPNGGHLVFGHMDAPPKPILVGDVQAFAADAQEIAQAANGDFLEFVSERVLGPIARFGFGEITITMGRSQVHTRVELLGDPSLWAKAAPKFTATVGDETITAGHVSRGVLTADWDLTPQSKKGTPQKPARWGKTFAFKAEATQPKGVPNPPQAVSAPPFTAAPSLDALDITISDERIEFAGRARAFPTDLDCRVQCEVRGEDGVWQAEPTVCGAIVYQRSSPVSNRFGRVNEDGSFRAWVRRSAFVDQPGPFRFVWFPVGQEAGLLEHGQVAFHDLSIKAALTREYPEGELRAVGAPQPGRADAAPQDDIDEDAP